MAKFDVVIAYRNVGIHPRDRPLLGMMWRDKYLVDMALSFGLQSAPYIFRAIADTVQWMATHNHGVDFPHYLDNFLPQVRQPPQFVTKICRHAYSCAPS